MKQLLKILIITLLYLPCAAQSGVLANAVAGEAIPNYTCVYFAANGKAYKADPLNRAKQAVGVVYRGASINDTMQVLFSGWTRWEGLTLLEGRPYYLTTDGALTATQPTNYIQLVGIGINDSTLCLAIQTMQAAVLESSQTLDFSNVAAGLLGEQIMTVIGAAVGDLAAVIVPDGANVDLAVYKARVTATDTVTISLLNTGSILGINPPPATFGVKVFK